ncbi:enoyl-CoA hydratase/isomerase family protein [Streptomyces sp. C1-1]|uniref:enoyl-CoA hydratase/isomerase family protein n=1 Tax=Streptomyces sp. C1-1 TaxID=3231173 RepID=UPI003CFBDA25
MEDASEHSGLTFIAAVNGSCAGGGYELALACDRILLIDDNSSAVALPEVPLLGVLPGTGGLTRLTDKRLVRKDLADVFATRSDGVRGKTAVDWGLVDEVVRGGSSWRSSSGGRGRRRRATPGRRTSRACDWRRWRGRAARTGSSTRTCAPSSTARQGSCTSP